MIAALSPARRAAIAAIVAALLTATAAAALGGAAVHRYGAFAYVALAGISIASPRVITVQVIAGQILAAITLAGGAGLLALLPVIAGVILTTELLGIVARLDSPLGGHPAAELRHAASALLIGSIVFALVAVLGELPGPTGFLAIAIASAACLGLGWMLVREARHETGE